MKTDFKLIGLVKKRSFTCSNLDKEDIFWPEMSPVITQEVFNQLFSRAKSEDDFWKKKWIAEIEHDGYFEDMTPKDAVVVGFRPWDLN